VLEKIEKIILNNNSDKIIFGKDYNYKKNTTGFLFKDNLGEINLPFPNLTGDFQISNVSTAIATARSLNQFKITNSHIKKSITKIRSEGRLQEITEGKLRDYVSKNNQILIDGAHNTLAASVIEKYLKNLNSGKKIIMLLGMMANKEHKEFIQIFKDRVHSIIALDVPNQINFIDKKKLSKIAESCGIPSRTENSIKTALKNASKENSDAIIFCTGSLYFAGEILNLN
jgi:dihydrofolate synthase/folylpolyglutamate synthase